MTTEPMIPQRSAPDLFCHVHVPKTGGTSLNQVLARWFLGAFEVLDHPDPAHTVDSEAFGQYLIERPSLSCISTHHLRAFPAVAAGRRVHYFTILREPLDRTVSLLSFMKKYAHEFTDQHKRTLPEGFERANELDILKEWTEQTSIARRNGEFAGNPVAAMFIGSAFHCELLEHRRACEAAAVARCISVLNRFLYVGDFACFEQSVIELASRIRALGASTCDVDRIPTERVSRDVRGDLKWLEEGRDVVDAYMDGLTVDGMVYRHFAYRNAGSRPCRQF